MASRGRVVPKSTRRHVLRRLGRDRRTARSFAANLLGAFGAVSALLQFAGPLLPGLTSRLGQATLLSLGPCVAWAAIRASQRTRVRREFRHPDMTVVVERGDLFGQRGNLVVGFCDTFDAAVPPHGPVSPGSVQGQFLRHVYHGDWRRLDRDLAAALRDAPAESRERHPNRPAGRAVRYPVGTVATLRAADRLVFAVAYSRLSDAGVAQSSVEDLWFSLNRLWDAVYQHGQQAGVALPLVGAGLARLHALAEDDILRLILLSFVTRSREQRVCRELRVIIAPGDLPKIDLPEAGAFLRSLGASER